MSLNISLCWVTKCSGFIVLGAFGSFLAKQQVSQANRGLGKLKKILHLMSKNATPIPLKFSKGSVSSKILLNSDAPFLTVTFQIKPTIY